MPKMHRKVAEKVHAVALTLAAVVAVLVYLSVPLTGRGSIGIATLAAGAAVYVALRALAAYGWARLNGRRPARSTAHR